MLLPIESFSSLHLFGCLWLWFAQDWKLINDMTSECVGRNRSSGFEIFPQEMKEKAVFAEHLPLRETELFNKLPVIIVGHIILPPDSDPTEELGAYYGACRLDFKTCL
jgi:hypothetical protein